MLSCAYPKLSSAIQSLRVQILSCRVKSKVFVNSDDQSLSRKRSPSGSGNFGYQGDTRIQFFLLSCLDVRLSLKMGTAVSRIVLQPRKNGVCAYLTKH